MERVTLDLPPIRPPNLHDHLTNASHKEVLLLITPHRDAHREGCNVRGKGASAGADALQQKDGRALVVHLHGTLHEVVHGNLHSKGGSGGMRAKRKKVSGKSVGRKSFTRMRSGARDEAFCMSCCSNSLKRSSAFTV